MVDHNRYAAAGAADGYQSVKIDSRHAKIVKMSSQDQNVYDLRPARKIFEKTL